MSRVKIFYVPLLLLALAACQSANTPQANIPTAVPATAEDVPRMRVQELKALLEQRATTGAV